uniref:60S ribosomal protein L29 n=1 Tax=Trepomonas sp. PC1 TaxID=1076344 RepID=A0A146KMR1_9EUKA|eukprot:JAP96369.1 Ribosomal protein L29e [Trepomonas sp. PC1]
MSKSKVASQKGNNRKSHRNGIKKAKTHPKASTIGVNQKYLHNCHHARVGRVKHE